MAQVEVKTFIKSRMNDMVCLLPSHISGNGLFVNKDIEANSFLHVTHVHRDLAGKDSCENTWINLTPNHLYNHSKKNENCRVITDGLTKGLIATKNIAAWEEILVDYTEDKELEQPQSGWTE